MKRKDRRKIAKLIVKCFKKTDWERQCFHVGGEFMKSTKGEKRFYGCVSIDESIKKLNRLLDRLNK